MNYIVLDLEWNQSAGGREESVEHLPFEIIELGAVKLDGCLRPVGEFHGLIRPQVYRTLHFKISEVTHMDIEELRQEGEPFPEVMAQFLRWCGAEEYRFCTWGSMDLTELQRNMAYHGMEMPFARPLLYLDVQKLYCLQFGDGKTKESLDQAVRESGLSSERPFHRALDDAFYTGRVMALLDLERWGEYLSVDYYHLPQTEAEQFWLHFPTYSKFVSREFESRDELLKDKSVTEMRCQVCNRCLRKKIRWFSWGQKTQFCLAVCPEHGGMRGKLRIKKSEQGHAYAVKTIRAAVEDEAALLVEKREEGRRKRRHAARREES